MRKQSPDFPAFLLNFTQVLTFEMHLLSSVKYKSTDHSLRSPRPKCRFQWPYWRGHLRPLRMTSLPRSRHLILNIAWCRHERLVLVSPPNSHRITPPAATESAQIIKSRNNRRLVLVIMIQDWFQTISQKSCWSNNHRCSKCVSHVWYVPAASSYTQNQTWKCFIIAFHKQ